MGPPYQKTMFMYQVLYPLSPILLLERVPQFTDMTDTMLKVLDRHMAVNTQECELHG